MFRQRLPAKPFLNATKPHQTFATGGRAKDDEEEDEEDDDDEEDDEYDEDDDEDDDEEEDEADDEEEENNNEPPCNKATGGLYAAASASVLGSPSTFDSPLGLDKESTGMSSLDKLTMELLLPKNVYNKYLSKSDPERFKERQEFAYQVKRHRHNIMRTLEQCLDKVCAGPLQEDAPSYLSGGGAAVNPDTMACFEQLCKIVVHDIELQNAPQGEKEMFSECDISRYSLDNFQWRQHGLRVQKR